MKDLGALVRVKLTVEIDVGPWGGDADCRRLFEQGEREAIERLERILGGKATIVGEPEATIVVGRRV